MSFPPLYKLLDWVPVEKLDRNGLSYQPKAVEFLRENPKYINWKIIASNSAALSIIEENISKINFSWLSSEEHGIHILKKYKKRIYWQDFSCNEAGISMIEENLHKISWTHLSGNEKAIHILENNIDKIDWEVLSANKAAISLLEKHIDKIDWRRLGVNENALHLLKSHPDKINFCELPYNNNPEVVPMLLDNMFEVDMNGFCSRNEPEVLEYIDKNFIDIVDDDWNNVDEICKNKDAFYILEKNMDYLIKNYEWLFWTSLSGNENEKAIELLRSNQHQIDWKRFSENPGIFKLDTQKMKSRCAPFAQELAAYVYSPSRLMRLCEKYDIEMSSLLEIFE